jgi:hypothetical protein
MGEQKPYVYQPYPRQKFHRSGTAIVNDAEAEAALGEGWRDSPNDPFGLPPGSDPLRWLDSWDLSGLAPDAIARIQAGLVDAHADVVSSRGEEGTRVRQESMQKAFNLFAKEFLAAELLTELMMVQAIPQYVYDAAVSGGWETGAIEKNSACTLPFGHHWVPEDVPSRLRELFAVQFLRWQAKVLLHSTKPGSPGAEVPSELQPNRAALKQSPITQKASGLPARRHGFEANLDRHKAIAHIVERHSADWRTGSRGWRNASLLKKICADLDQNEIDTPPNWRKENSRGIRLKGWDTKLGSWGTKNSSSTKSATAWRWYSKQPNPRIGDGSASGTFAVPTPLPGIGVRPPVAVPKVSAKSPKSPPLNPSLPTITAHKSFLYFQSLTKSGPIFIQGHFHP